MYVDIHVLIIPWIMSWLQNLTPKSSSHSHLSFGCLDRSQRIGMFQALENTQTFQMRRVGKHVIATFQTGKNERETTHFSNIHEPYTQTTRMLEVGKFLEIRRKVDVCWGGSKGILILEKRKSRIIWNTGFREERQDGR